MREAARGTGLSRCAKVKQEWRLAIDFTVDVSVFGHKSIRLKVLFSSFSLVQRQCH
jgi:hypothetical protein